MAGAFYLHLIYFFEGRSFSEPGIPHFGEPGWPVSSWDPGILLSLSLVFVLPTQADTLSFSMDAGISAPHEASQPTVLSEQNSTCLGDWIRLENNEPWSKSQQRIAGNVCHMCRHHEPGEHSAMESGHKDTALQNTTTDQNMPASDMSLWHQSDFELGLPRDKTCLVQLFLPGSSILSPPFFFSYFQKLWYRGPRLKLPWRPTLEN